MQGPLFSIVCVSISSLIFPLRQACGGLAISKPYIHEDIPFYRCTLKLLSMFASLIPCQCVPNVHCDLLDTSHRCSQVPNLIDRSLA
ncbi:hypothetical protein EV421DRAFT_1403473 [Armillaria borealis]|uniref:Secreted protein n=1 Tax=Armillaria borealis TaxID=47425 RepID=A0AA39JXH4_9AGAR|nr:hypothetical protein EV421DRAFT_1403473 [Armillaria borealis]